MLEYARRAYPGSRLTAPARESAARRQFNSGLHLSYIAVSFGATKNRTGSLLTGRSGCCLRGESPAELFRFHSIRSDGRGPESAGLLLLHHSDESIEK